MVTVYFLKGVNIAQMKEFEKVEEVSFFLNRYYTDLRFRKEYDGFHVLGTDLRFLKREPRFGKLINQMPDECLV